MIAMTASISLWLTLFFPPADLDVRADIPITLNELADRLARGPLRLELDFDRSGKVVSIEVDDDTRDDDDVEDRVVAADPTRRVLTLEHLGAVDLTRTQRFEIDDRRVSEKQWWEEAQNRLARGASLYVEAEGRFERTGFSAWKIEIEDPGRPELAARIGKHDLDITRAELKLGPLTLPIGGVPIRLDD